MYYKSQLGDERKTGQNGGGDRNPLTDLSPRGGR
jgi:hypothetical protein